jgi:FkbM family methyltransferase
MLRWLTRLTWLRVRHVPGPAIATLKVRGLWFTLDWASFEHVPLREILVRGEYWPTPAFRPTTGQVIVDVGANAGVFATVAGSWIGPTGRLVAIEPNPAAAGRLLTNLRQNGIDARATVIQAALSDHAGWATLYVGSNSTTGSLAPDPASSGTGIGIVVGSLDAIASETHLGEIDVLKVDVEGMETQVLDGGAAVLATCRRAVIEVSYEADVAAVMDRCEAAGFDRVDRQPAGADSGATIVFAERA